MKKRLLVLPILALSLGVLSSCTKDDIKALQDKDTDLQSQIDELKGEVAGLKNQITDLKAELASKVEEVKADYNAKIDAAKADIQANETALATLTSTYNSEKAALEAALRAEIKAVDDKYAPEIAALKAKDQELQTAIDNLDDNSGDQYTELQAQITANKNRLDALESQVAEDKAELSADYNAKITALQTALTSESQARIAAIADLQDQIDDLTAEMQQTVVDVQADYNAKINALTVRIAALEDIPSYTVTFDLNYDYFDGTVAQSVEVEVLKGSKVNEITAAESAEVERPGNILTGWTFEETGKDWSFFGYPVTQDMTLKAQWAADPEATHEYVYSEGFTFQREKLDVDGHRRYKCSIHGNACYLDTKEKAGLLYIEDSFKITGRGTVVTGEIVQGRFYVGQEVTIQHVDGTLHNHTIIGLEKYMSILDVAVAGDDVGILFAEDDLAKADVARGCLLCKANEALLNRTFNVNFHLFSSEEQSLYADIPISARHTPIITSSVYRPSIKLGNTSRVVALSITTESGEELMYPGETATATMTFAQLSALSFVPTGNDWVYIYESSSLVGYVQILTRDLVSIISSNTETEYFDYTVHQNPDGFYLHDDDQYWDYETGWNAHGGYPEYKRMSGWSKDKNSTNPEYPVNSYVNSDVSSTFYIVWEYRSFVIFDVANDAEFTYSHDDTKGEAVTGTLVRDMVLVQGTQAEIQCGDFYTGATSTTTYIDWIQVDDAFYEEYSGEAGDVVTIYLRNLTDASMADCCGVCFDSTVYTNISANIDNGGRNSEGQALRTFQITKNSYLPKVTDYIGATRTLLGFSANADATEATYAPGALYTGSDSTLYAIWSSEEIFSTVINETMFVTGRGTYLKVVVKGSSITLDDIIYVQYSDSTVTSHVVVGVHDPETGKPIATDTASVGQEVYLLMRGLSNGATGVGCFVWAA